MKKLFRVLLPVKQSNTHIWVTVHLDKKYGKYTGNELIGMYKHEVVE